MTLPLAIGLVEVIIIFVVADLVLWLLWVGLRHQRQREAAGGREPDQPPPEPAPERRE